MLLVIGLVAAASAVALVIYAFGSQAEERATIRSSLRQLEGYDVQNVRDQELLNPLRDRTISPILGKLTEIGNKFSPDGYREAVREKFTHAGRLGPDTVDRFLAIRVVTIVAAPLVFIFLLVLGPFSGVMGLALAGLIAFVIVAAPTAIVDRWVEARQHQIRLDLPNVLDLLVISVEAGLGLEQALDRTVLAVPGPLAQEFALTLGQIRAGSSRAEALRALDERCGVPELRSFVLAILQADKFGVSIGRVLRGQADEMRVKRRQLAQEKAQKIPVKMLIPMVFCIFPALFVVVLGPAIMNIVRELG